MVWVKNSVLPATLPGITFAVGKLSQFCEKSLQSHWPAVKRVYCYVKGTIEYGIWYGPASWPTIIGYSDSDWAGCKVPRKSTEAFVFLMAGGPISWLYTYGVRRV